VSDPLARSARSPPREGEIIVFIVFNLPLREGESRRRRQGGRSHVHLELGLGQDGPFRFALTGRP